MATSIASRFPHLHPLHAICLAFPVAMFTGALMSDVTYLNTAEMQWSNFSAWLITGALLFGAPVVAWALVLAFRLAHAAGRARALLYLALILVMWISGLVNAFQHGRDAWSSVGTLGIALSIVSTLTALAATWIAHDRRRVSS